MSCQPDVVVPEGVSARYPEVDPHMLTRYEEDRSPTTSTTNHLEPGASNSLRIDHIIGL